MKDFIEFIAKHMVDYPEKVEVEETENENKIVIRLKVDAGDIGKVIGKKGQNVQAMRILLTAIGAKEGKRVNLEIVEDRKVAE